jgi:type I restriction enzyme S subunit
MTFARVCSLHYEKFSDGTVKCIEDEIPFEIPNGWAWARLGSLLNLFITGPFGSSLHKSDYVSSGTPLINPMNIVNGRIQANPQMLVSQDTVSRLSVFKVLEGDIVIARRGEMGRCAVVESSQNGWLCGTGSFDLRVSRLIDSNYIAARIRASDSVTFLSGNSLGNTMLNLNQSILNSLLIPVPPFNEQRRVLCAIS